MDRRKVTYRLEAASPGGDTYFKIEAASPFVGFTEGQSLRLEHIEGFAVDTGEMKITKVRHMVYGATADTLVHETWLTLEALA